MNSNADVSKPDATRPGLGEDPAAADRLFDALNWESRRTAALLGMLNRAMANHVKLNPTDVEALGVLAVVGAVTPTRLASLMAMGTGSMTLVIDRLERAGFVRRVRDTKDRRSLTVEIVEERTRELAALYAPLRTRAVEISRRYTGSELAVIADYFTRSNDMLYELVTDLTERPAPPPE